VYSFLVIGVKDAEDNYPYPGDIDLLILPRNIQGPCEDWADSFAVYFYPDYFNLRLYRFLGPIRRQYIDDQIKQIPLRIFCVR